MNKRPKGITFLVILQFIFATFKAAQWGWVKYANPEAITANQLIVAMALILFQILLALGLLRAWNWCRIVTIIFCVRKVLGIFKGFSDHQDLTTPVIAILLVSLAITSLIIWYLTANKKVKAYFLQNKENPNQSTHSIAGSARSE